MRTAFRRVGVGLYLLWLVAVVVLVLGRHTPLPALDVAHDAVVAGATVLTALGAVQYLRAGRDRLRDWRS